MESISEEDLADLIDKSNADYGDDTPLAEVKDFPQAYLVKRLLRKNDSPEMVLTSRISCKPDYSKEEKYKRPYSWTTPPSHTGRKRQYDFSEIVFELKHVRAYEKAHPHVQEYTVICPEDLPFSRNGKQQKDIRKLQAQVKRLTKEREELTSQIAQCEQISQSTQLELASRTAQCEELTAQIAQYPTEPPTRVRAERWEKSVQAALSLIVEIMCQDKRDWKRKEFQDEMNIKCPAYLSHVEEVAWNTLPSTLFKAGPGRPKTQKTSNTSE